MAKPDLFAYLDYRKYLRDAFAGLQAAAPSGRGKVSFRSFAKDAGYSSPNLLQLILSGSRDLTAGQVPGTIRALGLNKQEADFFANLVAFEQAEGFEEKNFHYQRMLRSRRHSEARPIDKGRFEYLDKWYHSAVRELIAHPDFTGDPAWIAKRVHPRISTAQAGKSLDLLLRLGLIRRDADTGRLYQAEAQLSTAPEVASLAVSNYHRAMLKLAENSIESFDGESRDLRAVTLGIPKDRFPELKRKLETFWRELLDLSVAGDRVEEVYQVNLQAFPLTKAEDGHA